MRRLTSARRALAILLLSATVPMPPVAAECPCGRDGCTGPAAPECAPACKASWEEKKAKKSRYAMKCEYACARAAEPWHTGSPECRCSPPCGNVYVKKRFFKTEEEKVERVPKYEVRMMPTEPSCPGCPRCSVCWWNPLSVLRHLLGH